MSWFRRAKAPPARIEPSIVAPLKPTMKVSHEALASARRRQGDIHPFRIPEPPPGVVPNDAKMAMDDCLTWAAGGRGYLPGMFSEGLSFFGYQLLAEMAQRAEYRRITETIAREMTRKWIKLSSKGDEDKTDRINKLNDALKKFRVQDVFREAAEHDGYFGRGQIYIDTGDTDNPNELSKPLVPTPAKIRRNGLKGLKAVEPMWTYPSGYNATNPLKKDFYKPTIWYSMSTKVHASRLLQLVGREVPDLLKPAYMFGGLSMTQMAKEYVDRWIKTAGHVNRMIGNYSTNVLMTDMASTLSGDGGSALANRVGMFNAYRDNDGTLVLDKTAEDFKNVPAQLSGLDKLQAQAQEHICSITGMPLVIYTGISPSGLNASGDVELDCWDNYILAYQEHLFRHPLNRVLEIVQLSEFGDIDHDIVATFEPLRQMTAKERAEINKLKAETDGVYFEMAAIGAPDVRKKIATDEDSDYQGLDVDDMPLPPVSELDDVPRIGTHGGNMAPELKQAAE